METCLFEGKQICAYDVTDKNFVLNYELKKTWKLASDEGKLLCEECRKEVILKARDPRKKAPHFSHKITDEKCPYSNETLRESEEHKKGKMILYNYFKEHYTDANIILNHRLPNRRRADLFIEFLGGTKLAVEFQRTELDIRTWQERNTDYGRLNINTLWLLSGKEETLLQTKNQVAVSFFQQVMLNELQQIAIYLDVESVKLILAKNMKFINPYRKNHTTEQLFIKAYPLDEVVIYPDGQLACAFISDYAEAYDGFTKLNTEKSSKAESQRKLAEERAEKEKSIERERLAHEAKRLNDENFHIQVEGFKKLYIQKNITLMQIMSSIPESDPNLERFRNALFEFDKSIRDNIASLKQQLPLRDESKELLELSNNELWKAACRNLHFDLNSIPDFINIKINCEEFYFNCHRSLWQSAIFLRIALLKREDKKFNSLELADWFLVTTNVPINFDMYDILYIERFDPKLLNAEEVIFKYLISLEQLGHVKRITTENKCTDFFIKL
jgi:hypothetical protein